MKQLLPIGISDYKDLREKNYYYVDKTLLIQEVQENGQVILVARPRRFGKTLNLSMLRYFYEPSETTHSLFSDTAIWKLPEYRQLQGAFPVIFISFRTITDTSFEDMLAQFAYVIAIEFDRHAYLLSGTILTSDEKDLFNKIISRRATGVDLGNSLEFLVRMLHKYHNKKVVVLIDEYDVPVQTAYIYNFYAQIIPFLKKLLTGALKDQEALEKGVVTGNLALAKAGIFTGLNNVDVFNLTRAQMSDKFGFTSQEMKALLSYYNFADRQDDIRTWYDGYRFGDTSGIFNPWSALKCIAAKGELDPYWTNTSDNILLKMLIGGASEDIKIDLESVLQKKPVRHRIEESIVFTDLSKKSNLMWSLLLYSGYLTYTHYEIINKAKEWFLIIPNDEIQKLLTDLVSDIFLESIVGKQAQNLLTALTSGNVKVFSTLLQSFVSTSMSTFDITADEPEKSYHLFVLGILVMIQDTYDVLSNRESGLGRYDIMLIPKNKQKPGVIIEFKKVWSNSNETLEATADKALNQIISLNYKQELENRGIDVIIAYGIAFEKKLVSVKCATFSKGKEVTCQSDT